LGDAMTALDPLELDHCTAVWATVAYAVANMDDLLPRTGDYPAGPVATTPSAMSHHSMSATVVLMTAMFSYSLI